MNSYNHHMLGSVVDYLIHIAGFRPNNTIAIPSGLAGPLSFHCALRGTTIDWTLHRNGTLQVELDLVRATCLVIPCVPPNVPSSSWLPRGLHVFTCQTSPAPLPMHPPVRRHRFQAYYEAHKR